MAERISIIDDNQSLLTSLALQLQSSGYIVTKFNCPQQALDFHMNEPADFYIIDIKMLLNTPKTYLKDRYNAIKPNWGGLGS